MPSARLSEYPLCSSKEFVNTLLRLGVKQGKRKKGTHASFFRETEDGRLIEGIVLVGKREIKRLTLKSMLEKLEIPLEDFKQELK